MCEENGLILAQQRSIGFKNLVDDDNEAYRALFQNTDYQQLMRVLTRGRGEWKFHPSTSEVTIFHMKTLTPVAKV